MSVLAWAQAWVTLGARLCQASSPVHGHVLLQKVTTFVISYMLPWTTKPFKRGVYFLKERICLERCKFFPVSADLIVKEGKTLNERVTSPENNVPIHINTEAQIKGGIEDISKIIFLISKWKYML